MKVLNYFPGQLANILLEVRDIDGYFADSLIVPLIISGCSFIADGYDGYELTDGYLIAWEDDGYAPNAVAMTKFDVGRYYAKVRLPVGNATVGNYILNVRYVDPSDGNPKIKAYQIITARPYGASVGVRNF